MKVHKFLIYIIIFIHLFFNLIQCKALNNTKNLTESENSKNDNNKREESSKEKEKEAEVNDNDAGFFISDEIFDEKLKNILEEKNLKPKKKITKQQLRAIFEIIYKTEPKEDDIKPEEIDPEINPEVHSKQFMDSIFNEATKSLDYDDKIKVKEIKEWINPTRVQKAYLELLQGLSENIDYL